MSRMILRSRQPLAGTGLHKWGLATHWSFTAETVPEKVRARLNLMLYSRMRSSHCPTGSDGGKYLRYALKYLEFSGSVASRHMPNSNSLWAKSDAGLKKIGSPVSRLCPILLLDKFP